MIALAGAACDGPVTPSVVEGEPVCPDFEIGATRAKMRGSLRFPVQVTIHEGDTVLSTAVLFGRRQQGAQASRVLVPDDNGEYEVRWTQCENERAPRPIGKTKDNTAEVAEYQCGSGAVYKTEKITTKRGDAASRQLTFPMPPKTECWVSETQATPEVTDAGAPPPAEDAGVDAGAGTDLATDAGAGTNAGADASAEPADAGADAAADAAAAKDAGGDAAAGDKTTKKPAATKKAAPAAPAAPAGGDAPY